jgi:hypothetical protein
VVDSVDPSRAPAGDGNARTSLRSIVTFAATVAIAHISENEPGTAWSVSCSNTGFTSMDHRHESSHRQMASQLISTPRCRPGSRLTAGRRNGTA